MKKHLLASVGLTALMVASSAKAADMLPMLKAPAPPAWNWSGFYIGGHAGYGWGHDPQSDQVFGTAGPPIGDINSQGVVWGFQAGANWQSGSWVGGLEIDLSGAGIKGSSSSSADTISVFGTETETDRFDLLGSARARFGFLPVPNVLVYGTAGPAWTEVTRIDEGSVFAFGFFQDFRDANPSWRFGLAAGVGVEARLGDSNWLGRVEYLHYDFGNSGSFPGETFGLVSSGPLTLDVVRAGLSYKFTQARPGSGYAMPVKAVPAAPWTWSGFYLGAHAGYGWGRDPTDDTDPVVGTINSNGGIGGFQAGANWQSGAFVGGLEIDVSGTAIKGSVTDNGGDTIDKFDWLNSARARLGYLVLPGTLLYGTGGTAWTRLDQTFTDGFTGPSWEFGWVAGVGVETRLGATNWLGRVEYLHYDFGDSGSFTESGTTVTSGHLTADVVRAGLSYKLDWSGAGPANRVMMPLKAAPAAAWNWDGFYLGGHGGYGWGRDPQSDVVFGFKFGDVPARTTINSQGFVAGFQAGANWQMGSYVVGLETDLSATGIKGSRTNVGTSFTETDTDKFDTLGSARARLGYLAWPNVLLYGTGGLAWTRLDQSNINSNGNGGSSPEWRFGWVAGAGGETRLWDTNWLVRLEYLHYDFGDSGSRVVTEFFGGPPTGETLNTGHLTADVLRAGLSYKFR